MPFWGYSRRVRPVDPKAAMRNRRRIRRLQRRADRTAALIAGSINDAIAGVIKEIGA